MAALQATHRHVSARSPDLAYHGLPADAARMFSLLPVHPRRFGRGLLGRDYDIVGASDVVITATLTHLLSLPGAGQVGAGPLSARP